jgi:hypothetical protein
LLYQQMSPDSPFRRRGQTAYRGALRGLRDQRAERIESLAVAGECAQVRSELAVLEGLAVGADLSHLQALTGICGNVGSAQAAASRPAETNEGEQGEGEQEPAAELVRFRGQVIRRSRRPHGLDLTALLAEARRAYLTGNHRRAIEVTERILEVERNHRDALRIFGVSSCYLRRRVKAASVYARLGARDRQMVRQVCARMGVALD